MKTHSKIPKALEQLKLHSGANWPKCRKFFIDYLDHKREIENSDLNVSKKAYVLKLIYRDYQERELLRGEWLYQESDFTKSMILSHLRNVLRTLNVRCYSSEILCFIQDSYNTAKSGNKKYPQL